MSAWVRMSPEEIKKDKWSATKRSFVGGFIVSLLFVFIAEKKGRIRSSYVHDPWPWSQVFGSLPVILLITTSVALLWSAYIYSNFETGAKAVACMECGKIKSPDNEQRCSCGGKFANLNVLKKPEGKISG